MKHRIAISKVIAVALFLFLCSATAVLAVGIDSTDKYSWGENIGWLNWGTPEGAVDAPFGSGDLTGYVWGENVGWISLNCLNTASCGTADYGVSRTGAALSGYAWGENVGWVSFSCSNTASCGTVDYGVTVDTTTEVFSGYAWGENVGWISLNCSNTSSCGTVDYRVTLAATPTPTPAPTPSTTPTPGAGGGGGGVRPTPTPFGSPAASPTVTFAPGTTSTPSPAGPSPTATPLGTPAAATPSAEPPLGTPPPSIFVSGVDGFSRWLDGLFKSLFGLLGPVPQELCGTNAVQTIACGATAIGLLAALAAIFAALLQGEIAAASFSLLQAFGLRRKARVWGVVYDTKTKRPVPLAKVELYGESGRLLETRFADSDGRYGFLTSPKSMGQGELNVSIRPVKPGYDFPSKRITGDVDYVVYDRPYTGGSIALKEGGLVNYSIPMDPVSERRVALSGFGKSLIGTVGDRLLSFGFYIGLVVVPLNYFLIRTTANLVILSVFLLVNLLRLFVVYRPYGITRDGATGKPLPYALVILNDLSGKRVAFAVSDEHGRYILSGKPGQTYEVVAYTPANTQPQRTVKIHTRGLRGRGWVTERLKI